MLVMPSRLQGCSSAMGRTVALAGGPIHASSMPALGLTIMQSTERAMYMRAQESVVAVLTGCNAHHSATLKHLQCNF